MQYIIKAYDGKNMLEKRLAVRDRHLKNMSRIIDKVICAGGIMDEEGIMKGSLLVMDFGNEEELNNYLNSEPYILEHVWQDITVENMNVVILNGQKVER